MRYNVFHMDPFHYGRQVNDLMHAGSLAYAKALARFLSLVHGGTEYTVIQVRPSPTGAYWEWVGTIGQYKWGHA